MDSTVINPGVERGSGIGPFFESHRKGDLGRHKTPEGGYCDGKSGIISKVTQYSFNGQTAEVICDKCGGVDIEST